MATCSACRSETVHADETGRCPSCASRPRIGRYRLDRLLGEGGYAEVWLAADSTLQRPVALKLLRPGVAARDVARRRFLRESKVLASLAHPNVVRVFDVGEDGGRVYLVLELVEGEPLSAVLDSRDPRGFAAALAGAAAGVHHAHEHGVIHRDLKPANILVDRSGVAKVADFGLAHLTGSESALTLSGSPVGTPLYMAPEQVEGRGRDLTPAIDIYALGAILYEGLAGRPPHVGRALPELYRRILEEDPVPPRRIRPSAPAELEWVALKCLDRSPGRRYPTARALADDLQRFVDGVPVQARPAGRTARFARRLGNRTGVLAGVVLLAGILAGAAFFRGPSRSPVPTAAPIAQATPPSVRPARDRAFALLETGRQALDRALRERYRQAARPEEIRRSLQAAATPLQEAVSEAPDFVPARLHLGLALEALGDRDGAERELREAIRLDPEFGPARYRLGRLLLDRWFLAKAWFTMGGEHLIPAGHEHFVQEACTEIQRALAAQRTFEDPLLRDLAETALAVGLGSDPERAERARNRAAAHAGRDGEEDFWFLAAMAHLDTRLREDLDKALARRPHFDLALFWKGFSLLNEGRFAESKSEYDHAIALDPGFVLARLNRGYLRGRMGDRIGAMEDYEEAIRLEPRNAMARVNRAGILLKEGDLTGAMAEYDEALRIDSRQSDAYLGRSNTWSSMGKLRRALQDADRAADVRPDYYLAHSYRYQILARLGETEEAAAAARRALELAPPDWPSRAPLERFLQQATSK